MRSTSAKFVLLGMALFAFSSSRAEAQEVASPGGAVSPGGLTSPGGAASVAEPGAAGVSIFAANAPRSDQGLAVAGWLLYPSLFAGYVYNDNVYATPNNRVGLSGIQIAPSLEASDDHGLYKTMVSLGAAAIIYPGAGGLTTPGALPTTTVNNVPPTNVSGHASVTQIWAPTQDWTVVIAGNFFRGSGLFGASPFTNGFGLGAPGVTSPALSPSYIPGIGTLSAQQQYSNQYGGQLSVEKQINERTSLRATAYAQGVFYDSTPTVTDYSSGIPITLPSGNGQNGVSFGASTRGSFYVTPQIYVYAEPGADLRRYTNSVQDSNGFRATAGAGSSLLSLFNGEIYGGYQEQTSAYGYFGTQSAPAYGARIRYFPTPLLTLNLSVDSTLGAIQPTRAGLLGFLAGSQAAATSVTQQALLQADYSLNAYTALSVRGGFGETRTSAIGYTTEIWSGGANLSYNFWRNTSIVVSYGFTKTSVIQSGANVFTTGPALGYTQNVITAGFRYSY